MKIFSFVILFILILVIGLLRLNLPSNNITNQVALNSEASFFEKTIANVMMSDTVADWRYIDLVVVKYACSERLNMMLIGLPFKRWEKCVNNSEICK